MYDHLDTSFRSFYQRVHNTTYIIDTPELTNCRTLYSKDGWLLVLRGDTEIFFFNPVTRKIINLPECEELKSSIDTVTSFSSVPTSPDCVVFVVINTGDSQEFSIIRRGESEWDSYSYDGVNFKGSCSNPVFRNGMFYYMDIEGCLGTFKPPQDKNDDYEDSWTILEEPNKPCNSFSINYLVDCQGDLIWVFVGRFGKWIKIFKLDADTMMWKKVKNLGDDALFLSQTTSLSVSTPNLGMGNKIFFTRFWGKNGCSSKNSTIFYSLDTCKFHSLGTSFRSDDFYGTTLKHSSTWLTPVDSNIIEEEFSW